MSVMNKVIDYDALDYGEDPRIGALDDGSWLIPDALDHDNDRKVVRADQTPGTPFHDTWFVVGANFDDATLTDPGDRYGKRRWAFASVEAAVYTVIGGPQQLEDLGNGFHRLHVSYDLRTKQWMDLLVEPEPGGTYCAYVDDPATTHTDVVGHDTPEAAVHAFLFGDGA